MDWYGQPNTERMDMRVPKRCKVSIAKYLLWLNKHGKQFSSQTDFILWCIDKQIAPHAPEFEAYWMDKFKGAK